jgi:hypothetical protein
MGRAGEPESGATEGFAAEAHRESRAVAVSDAADDDQAFMDPVSEWPTQE